MTPTRERSRHRIWTRLLVEGFTATQIARAFCCHHSAVQMFVRNAKLRAAEIRDELETLAALEAL